MTIEQLSNMISPLHPQTHVQFQLLSTDSEVEMSDALLHQKDISHEGNSLIIRYTIKEYI